MQSNALQWEDLVDLDPSPDHVVVTKDRTTEFIFVPPTAPGPQRDLAARTISKVNLAELRFTGPQYDAYEQSAWVWLARANNKAIGFSVVRLQEVLWAPSWAQYDSRQEPPRLKAAPLRWSIDLVWVFSERRRRGVAWALLEAAAKELSCVVADFAWAHPLSSDGEALARACSPDFVLIS